ncbi:unnamed protein product [Prorocentrum cordatum]|uniref:Uncharacterized protein n=1 Tax=Prorocentrum cordatum TaxID=2364126 RepID=A0ABN9V2R8_9DINO|nr:unnamed protein product [Polarella glacialis]
MSDASAAWGRAWREGQGPPQGGTGAAAPWLELLDAVAPRTPRTGCLWELCEDALGLWELCGGGAGSGARASGAAQAAWEIGADLLETFGAGLAAGALVTSPSLGGVADVPGLALATAPALLAAGGDLAAPDAGRTTDAPPEDGAVRTADASALPASAALAHGGGRRRPEAAEEDRCDRSGHGEISEARAYV